VNYGWRARIGFITPSNTLETPAYEFYLMAPEGVTLVGACLSVNELTPEAIETAQQQVEKVAKGVAAYSVDYLVVGGGPLAYIKGGRGDDRTLGRRVSLASGVTAVSEMTATVDALRSFGARRIAVATPFHVHLRQNLRFERLGSGLRVEQDHLEARIKRRHHERHRRHKPDQQ